MYSFGFESLFNAFVFGVFSSTAMVLLANMADLEPSAVLGIYLASLVISDFYLTAREVYISDE